MKVIVGLGNPGKKYHNTRHNIGFEVVDAILVGSGTKKPRIEKEKAFEFVRISAEGEEIILVKPSTFMNESGRAVRNLIRTFDLSAEQCLVVVDDVNLPIGKIRFRLQGSAGGHNGLQSIIDSVQTNVFPRLRVGVGQPGVQEEDLATFVLSQFLAEERALVESEVLRAREACLKWVSSASEQVMQEYNT